MKAATQAMTTSPAESDHFPELPLQEGQLLLEVWPGTVQDAAAPHAAPGLTSSASGGQLQLHQQQQQQEEEAVGSSAAVGAADGSGRGSNDPPASHLQHPPSHSSAWAERRGLTHGQHSGSGVPSSSRASSTHATPSSVLDTWPTCQLHFRVRDTGIGISPQDLGRLFRSFSQVGEV
jgi:signal transduction histidine kinase